MDAWSWERLGGSHASVGPSLMAAWVNGSMGWGSAGSIFREQEGSSGELGPSACMNLEAGGPCYSPSGGEGLWVRGEEHHLPGREPPQDGALGSGRVWASIGAVNLGEGAVVTRRTGPRTAGPGKRGWEGVFTGTRTSNRACC